MFFQTFLFMSDIYYGTDKPRNGSEEPISLLEVMVCISCTPPLDFILSFYLNPFSSLCVSASPISARYCWPLPTSLRHVIPTMCFTNVENVVNIPLHSHQLLFRRGSLMSFRKFKIKTNITSSSGASKMALGFGRH